MSAESYAFIYDDVVNDRRFERHVAELEVRLTSLDIQGRIARLTLFRNAKDLVQGMVSQGVSTIVIVGNDQSLDKMMWFLPDLPVTVGYLPITQPSAVADFLGIPVGAAACDVLAARYIEALDMGRLDERYFLTEVSLPKTLAAVDIEGRYRVSPLHGGAITIRNLGGDGESGERADPKDGLLEVLIAPHEASSRGRWNPTSLFGKNTRDVSRRTRILINKGQIISSEPVDVHVDHHVLNGFRFQISLVPQKLRFITGRSRRFTPATEPKARSRGRAQGSLPKRPLLATLPTPPQF